MRKHIGLTQGIPDKHILVQISPITSQHYVKLYGQEQNLKTDLAIEHCPCAALAAHLLGATHVGKEHTKYDVS